MRKLYNWVIYKMVSPSGKSYVGKTTRFAKRMNYYKNMLDHVRIPKRIGDSFREHGFAAHEVTVIDEFQGDTSLSNEKERFWIEYYKANGCKYPEIGLNSTDGGEGTVGYKATDEHRKRLSELHKKKPNRGFLGKKHSEETKNKIREHFTGRPNFKTRGVKLSEEHKMKLSAAKKGKAFFAGQKHTDATKSKISLTKKEWIDKLSPEERKIKFGLHNVGNTYNKGRIHKIA